MGGIEKSQALLELKASGDAMLKIGRKLGIGTSVVQRVFKQEPRSSLIERTEGRKRTIIAYFRSTPRNTNAHLSFDL